MVGNCCIERYNQEYANCKTLVKPEGRIMDKLMYYSWPGNVRELRNVLKRILVLGNWEEIFEDLIKRGGLPTVTGSTDPSSKELPLLTELLGPDSEMLSNPESFSLKEITKTAVGGIEKEVISHILDKTNWNRSQAAKALKISYKSLLSKINELNIEVSGFFKE